MTNWEKIRFHDLVIGDAIVVRQPVEVVRPRKKAAPDTSGDFVDITGRVVDRRDDRVRIEWIAAVAGLTHMGPKPHTTTAYNFRDARSWTIRYRPAASPTTRTADAGRAFMRDLLTAAAGDGGIDRIAACVDPKSCVHVGAHGAHAMVGGEGLIPEWVLRQLDGRLEIPEAIAVPEVVETAAARRTNGCRRVISDIPDPQVAAIYRAFPGAVVKEVRLRQDEDAGQPLPRAIEN